MRVFTRFLFVVLAPNLEFAGFRKQKNTELMTVSMEMVRMAKSRKYSRVFFRKLANSKFATKTTKRKRVNTLILRKETT